MGCNCTESSACFAAAAGGNLVVTLMPFFSRLCRATYVTCRVLTLAATTLLLATGMQAQDRTSLSPLQTMSAQGADIGAVPDSQNVPSITVTLKRTASQQADLESFLTDVRTKGSSSYHQWLTPAQFAQRFAPSADSVAQVTTWLQAQGLQVASASAGGMRLTVTGTAAQASHAFAVSLHQMALSAGGTSVTVKGTPSVPDAIAGVVESVSGLDATATSVNSVASLASAVDANTQAVVTADVSKATVSADELTIVLEQAAAQGQTVVLTGSSSTLLPARALLVVKGASAGEDEGETPRPDWQAAQGLPSDDLRAMPDAAVVDVNALAVGLSTVTTTSGRQGEIAQRFYQVAPEPGVFTHADASVADGTWAKADGLGTVDVAKLVKALAVGSTAPDSTTIALSSRNITHGQSITLTATITGSSGTPTGTVTFGSSQDGTLGSSPLSAGTTSGTAVATYTTNALPGGLHGFFGTYNGDGTYATSVTNTDTATIQPEAATVTGSVSGTPAVGTTIPVLVTVKSASGVGTPTGSVTVNPYGTALGQTAFTGTLGSTVAGTSTATVSIPATNAGTYTFQTNCTADASFSCNQPASFSVTEAKGTPVFTLKQTGSSAITLTAVAVVPSGAASTVIAPTGSVQFLSNGTSFATVPLDSTGTAFYAGTVTSTGPITATYSGDGNYNTATATANATTKVIPTVVLAVVTAGSSLSATVTPPSGTTTIPTGTVQFLLGTTAVGTGTLNASGVATFTGTYGSGILTAAYGGDTNFTTATSNAIDTTKVTPTVTLTKTSTATDGTVALSVAVTSTSTKTATGMVSFLDGTAQIGSGTLNASGVATFSGSLTKTGVSATARVHSLATSTVTHTLTAVYAGDTNFNTATSNAVTADATTTLIATTTALTSSSGYTGPSGTSFTMNVVVTPASYAASGVGPTGSVTISDASGVVGMGTVTGGTATVTLSTLSVGSHALTATYGGDTNYAASTSTPAVTITITPVTATLAATISPTGSIPYGYNATLNITATVTSGTAPVGTVTAVVSGNNGTYTATLSGATGATSSTAAISFPVPPPGTYTITVTCGTGMTCNTATVRLTTTKGFTTTTITDVPTSPQAGVPTTISATVANSGTGTGTYTYSGTISFYAGNKFLGKGTVSNGVATATITFLSASATSVTAIYSGDVNWNGSTSTAVSVTPLPLDATVTVIPSTANGIVGQNITLTASAVSSVTNASLVPSGTVTFYDTYNGVVVNLGSAALLSNGLNAAYATISTTGLRAGLHNIIAVYSGDAAFNKETSAASTVTMGDFTITFVPSSISISQGGTGQTTVLVTGVSGYSGSVALGCTPPGGSQATCLISPTSVTAGSTAVLTITTTKTTTTSSSRVVAGASAAGLIALLLVGGRRRRVAALLVLLLAVGFMSGGCAEDPSATSGNGNSGSGGTTTPGTPLGTMTFTVTGAALSAPVAAQRTAAVSVTVQ